MNDQAVVARMLASITHRGPDDQGLWNTEGVCLGHRRLSIIDLSAGGHQPMVTQDGRLALVFNGEIYNYLQLKQELLGLGHQFTSSSDTEVILLGYREWGMGVFQKLRGMWALALFDVQHQRLLLARDPFGIKPLYYSVQNDQLVFASELKALRSIVKHTDPDPRAYATFLTLGYFLAPDTCYQGISKLEPGVVQVWDIMKRMFVERQSVSYGSESVSEQRIKTLDEATQLLEPVLQGSVEAHFVSDVPVGVLFSGGTDSSLIAALARASGKRPTCYYVRFVNDTGPAYAEEIARTLRLPLETLSLQPRDVMDHYERIWGMIDEPTADVSMLPTSLIFQKIKAQGVKVVLSGEGGDEWFGGYLRHASLMNQGVFSSYVSTIEKQLQRLQGMQRSTAFLSAFHRLRQSLALKQDQNLLTRYLLVARTSSVAAWDSLVRERLSALHATHPLRDQIPPNLFLDLCSYLPNDLLVKNDLCSMVSSIEARVPFLDREVAQFVLQRLDPTLLLSPTYQGKALLKSVLARHLPSSLVYRPKKGFGISFREYVIPQFKEDVASALIYHQANAQAFGIPPVTANVFAPKNANWFLQKYPRFAFGLVASWKAFTSTRL